MLAASHVHLHDDPARRRRNLDTTGGIGRTFATNTSSGGVMRLKQAYKIPYPNGKIYVVMDLTGTVTYFGGPCTVWPHSRHVQVVCPPP